jgi:plastocyanin
MFKQEAHMKKKRIIPLVLLSLAIMLIITSCAASPYTTTTNPQATTTNSQATTTVSQSTTTVSSDQVSIENSAFNPDSLTVKAGATVTWTNNDSITHSIKSDSFNSPQLAKGDTFSFTFNNKGTFDYTCGIHPSMKGKIIVE